MITILDPGLINPSPLIMKYCGDGWHYPLDYQWIYDNLADLMPPDGEKILDVGSLFSEFEFLLNTRGYEVETMDRHPDGLYTHHGEFLIYDFNGLQYDCVMWVSSIEHQENLADIASCYLKSMELLKPGGIFIATFPVAVSTGWFEPAKQWNLSKQDAMRLFEQDTIKGNYQKIWENYRNDTWWGVRDKYVGRFGKWGYDDPAYLTAGVVIVK